MFCGNKTDILGNLLYLKVCPGQLAGSLFHTEFQQRTGLACADFPMEYRAQIG